MNESDRNTIDRLKNGIDQIERFDKFKEEIAKCSEIDLFVEIDRIQTYIIMGKEQNYPEWDKNDKYVFQAEKELAVEQTSRFGVQPFEPNSVKPTEQYFKWYKWWKDYIDGMSKEEWDNVRGAIENKEDVSKYRPNGDWK